MGHGMHSALCNLPQGNFISKIDQPYIILSYPLKSQVTAKQEDTLARWERFLIQQQGCYPAAIAAIKLRMTPQAVYQAAQRGWITFFILGRNRMYGRKDVITYRWERARRFRDNRPLPSRTPRIFR